MGIWLGTKTGDSKWKKELLILDTDEFNHGGCRGEITSIRYHTMRCLIVSYLRNGIKNDESKWNYNER